MTFYLEIPKKSCTFASMKREVYESQKAFSGDKKPSMQRRCVGHDYTERMMYMVTMTTESRRPLFGTVIGRSEAPEDSAEVPRVELTELGRRVEAYWHEIPVRYPQIKVIALQMMPDHFHGILFVREKLEKPMGKALLGFKQGCNKAYRELFPFVQSVAVLQQQTKPPKDDRSHGLLFARGFNDKLLLREGQLQRWLHYLHDNPRRLLMKREHPDLFRVQRGQPSRKACPSSCFRRTASPTLRNPAAAAWRLVPVVSCLCSPPGSTTTNTSPSAATNALP